MLDDSLNWEECDALFDSSEGAEPLPEPTANEVLESFVAGILADVQFAHCDREELERAARLIGRALGGDMTAAEQVRLLVAGMDLARTQLEGMARNVAKRR